MKIFKTLVAAVFVIGITSGLSYAMLNSASSKKTVINDGINKIAIQSSNGSGPLLVADNLSPGEVKVGATTFKNNSKLPVKLTVNPYNVVGGSDFNTKLVADKKVVYSGPSAGLNKTYIGGLSPGESVRVKMYGRLAPGSGNGSQGKAINFDLRWKATVDKKLPPECKYQELRARLFISKG